MRPVSSEAYQGTTPACKIIEIINAGGAFQNPVTTAPEPHYSAVMMELYKDTECRPEDKLYETYLKKGKGNYLMLSKLSNNANVSEEVFCKCFAEYMTKAVKGGAEIGGASYQNLIVKAQRACNKAP